VINATGKVLLLHLISGGKTAASEPHPSKQDKFKVGGDAKVPAVCSHTPNHWANHDTQCSWLKACWDRKVAMYQTEDGLTVSEAKKAPYVHMLDCWPVNLTEKLRGWVRDNLPGCELMFVPAGGTGRYQVNDTHCHKPLKGNYQAQAHSWFRRKLQLYRKNRKEGVYTEADFDAKVRSLMSMPRLRNKCLEWLVAAAAPLGEAPAGECCLARCAACAHYLFPTCFSAAAGLSIIGKGWEDIYLKPAGEPAFAEAAFAEHNARLAEKVAAAAAAHAAGVGAAAAAAAKAAAERGGDPASIAASVSKAVSDAQAAPAAAFADEVDVLLQQVAQHEQAAHLKEVPHVAERPSRSGKSRPGGRRGKSSAAGLAADEAEKPDSDEEHDALSGMKRKKRAPAAGAGAGAAKAPAAKRRAASAKEEDESEEDESDSGSESESGDSDADGGDEEEDAGSAAEPTGSLRASAGSKAKPAKRKGMVDEWTARDEKLIAAQWRVYVESDTGLSSDKAKKRLDKVRTTIQSVINDCMDNDEPARANAWEGMLQQIEAAVLLIPADSGHAVANMGELRL